MEIEACAKCAEGTEEDFEPFGTSFAGGEEPLTCPCCGGEFWSLVLLESRPTKHAPDVVESAASSDISPASEVSALEAGSTPATTQVM